jgi:hypothetical protein
LKDSQTKKEGDGDEANTAKYFSALKVRYNYTTMFNFAVLHTHIISILHSPFPTLWQYDTVTLQQSATITLITL